MNSKQNMGRPNNCLQPTWGCGQLWISVAHISTAKSLSVETLLPRRVNFRGRAVVQGLMPALGVVELKVTGETLSGFTRIVVLMQIHFFIFNGSPQLDLIHIVDKNEKAE